MQSLLLLLLLNVFKQADILFVVPDTRSKWATCCFLLFLCPVNHDGYNYIWVLWYHTFQESSVVFASWSVQGALETTDNLLRITDCLRQSVCVLKGNWNIFTWDYRQSAEYNWLSKTKCLCFKGELKHFVLPYKSWVLLTSPGLENTLTAVSSIDLQSSLFGKKSTWESCRNMKMCGKSVWSIWNQVFSTFKW